MFSCLYSPQSSLFKDYSKLTLCSISLYRSWSRKRSQNPSILVQASLIQDPSLYIFSVSNPSSSTREAHKANTKETNPIDGSDLDPLDMGEDDGKDLDLFDYDLKDMDLLYHLYLIAKILGEEFHL